MVRSRWRWPGKRGREISCAGPLRRWLARERQVKGVAMVFGVADIPDLSGRVAVGTGANGGLGLQTATVLAAKGDGAHRPAAHHRPARWRRRAGPLWAWYAARFGMSPAHPTMPQVRAATDPHASGGGFYGPRFTILGPAVQNPVLRRGNSAAIRTLWAVSERVTGLAINP